MRKLSSLLFAVAALPVSLMAAAPTIGAVVNSASYTNVNLPNSGIAAGSIFVVFGTGMGPDALAFGAFPRPNSVSGTSFSITGGGVTKSAPIIYTSANQAAAIMPSAIPAGTATVTVTYNNVPSAPFSVKVNASNVGLFTVPRTGAGPAVVDFADYSLVTSARSAKPGDTLILWATGLGATADDDAQGAAGGNVATPIQVWVGGVAATVVYHGRSPGSTGLDQINFIVPAGVTGCSVSLNVQTGNLVSNTATMAIMPSGGQCTDAAGYPNLQTLSSKPNIVLDVLLLDNESSTSTQNNKITTNTSSSAQAFFLKFTQAQFAAQYEGFFSAPSSGSCQASVNVNGGGGGDGDKLPDAIFLDAGPSLTLTPPSGPALPFALQTKGAYSASPNGLPGGAYTYSNGSGGADVAAFTQTVNVSPALIWTNQTVANTAIDRTQPLLFTWTGGSSSAFVQIDVSAGVANNSGVGVDVVCMAPVSANQFTIPASAMLALPPNGGGAIRIGLADSRLITIPGADAGLVQITTSTQVPASFK